MPNGSGSSSCGGGLLPPPSEQRDCCDGWKSCSDAPNGESPEPIRYGDGEILLSETDLSHPAFGVGVGHTRDYGNLLSSNSTGWNGKSWLVSQVQRVAPADDDRMAAARLTTGMRTTISATATSGHRGRREAEGSRGD